MHTARLFELVSLYLYVCVPTHQPHVQSVLGVGLVFGQICSRPQRSSWSDCVVEAIAPFMQFSIDM